MFLLVIAIILTLIGVGWMLLGEQGTRPAGIIGPLLGAVALVLACSTIVEAKNVGVVTSFGKLVGTMEPGYHMKKPWEKVTDIDSTVKTRKYDGEDDCLYVRIGDGSRSCVNLTLRWRVNGNKADVVYADYRADDPTAKVGSDLVSPMLKSSLQSTLGDYNPVASLKVVKAEDTGDEGAAVSFAPDFDVMNAELMKDLKGRSDLVEILDVVVTYVSISSNTQEQLDAFTKSVGQTVAAQQNKETSEAQAAANKALEKNVSQELNVARCIDALNKAIEKGYALPAGFNCLGAGPMVIPAGGAR